MAATTVNTLVEQYRAEKMPSRFSTRTAYESWLSNHILPRWGNSPITDLQARPVELWLHSLALSPKSRVHVRGLLHVLWDFTMWQGDVPTQRNPMELVTIKGATKRTRQPRSLTVEEFQKFVAQLEEPIRTIALVCVCFGLRISEALALRWSDVDWLNGKLHVERGIVRQQVDDVKTVYSQKQMSINGEPLQVLKLWKQTTQFSAQEDWVFASPVQLGALPVSYPWVWKAFQHAAAKAGIGKLSTHTMRHSYRSWLDAVGTTIAVQQKLMRHTDIRTTLNIYGDVVTDITTSTTCATNSTASPAARTSLTDPLRQMFRKLRFQMIANKLLLGHHDLKETMIYLHLSRRHLNATASPLDVLKLKETVPQSG
jgi:integrase